MSERLEDEMLVI